jgi:glycerophosphoryl diester phosphodiesterase
MAHAPENTLEAFALGIRLGANGLETDAWTTADGHVVLDHDGVVRKLARNRPISSLRLAELPSHIPTLAALFEKCGTDFDLSIDIKDDVSFERTTETARNCNFDLSRLWLCHYSSAVVLAQRSLLPDVRLVDSTRLSRIKEGLEMRCAKLASNGIDCLNMHHTDWTGGSTTLVHKFGLFAFGWDCQYGYVLTSALRMGLDAVFSDHVDTMVETYEREIGFVPRT